MEPNKFSGNPMASQNFPDEVFICILKWLPAKSLMKFLCVSKSWYSLITTLYFTSYYLHHNLTHDSHHPKHLLIIRRNSDHRRRSGTSRSSGLSFCVSRFGEELSELTELDLPWPNRLVVGLCNGLVCLETVTENYENSFCLWNPSTRRYINIGTLPINARGREHPAGYNPRTFSWREHNEFGFGFDSLTNDYKVIAITYCTKFRYPYAAQCYSLNAGSWSKVELPDYLRDEYNEVVIFEACFVNGVIHWVLVGKNEITSRILTFDVHNESFGEMRLPHELVNRSENLWTAVIDNSLCVIVLARDTYCVWQMKDYGVEESWNIIKLSEPSNCWDPSFWDKEEGKVFIFTTWGRLIAFNSKNQSCFVHGKIAFFAGQVFRYTESLELLDKCNRSKAPKTEGVINKRRRLIN